VRSLEGGRRAALAVLAGAASVLAMAPFHLAPVLLLTLAILVWQIDGAVNCEVQARSRLSNRWLEGPHARAAGVGWCFGFGYFAAGLFWIGEAFLVEAEVFAWLIPFAVTLLPAGLAIFFAAAAAAASCVWRPGLQRVVSLALALSLAEWLRGHVLTGFPWNVLGYALTGPLPLMQSAAVVGIYGLTLAAVLVLASPLVHLADAAGASETRRRWRHAALIVLPPLAVAWGYGSIRLAQDPRLLVDGVKLRLVQPSVPQTEKWKPENQARIFDDHIALSLRSPHGVEDRLAGITHVVWPEAAMPFQPLRTPAALAMIGKMLPPGTHLLSGALRLGDAPASPTDQGKAYNSLMAFGEGGRLVALYDKIQLVPFGEFLPMKAVLERIGLRQLTQLRGGFAPGVSPRPLLTVPGLPPLGALVCYEAIFPGAVVQGRERPQLLLNVTNDGWFGNTTGPRQHLHQARVRAVEEGLPLVRAANNGISAMIDPFGRIPARLDLNVRGVIDARLPSAISPPVYARLGDGPFFLAWIALAASLLARARHHNP
jgi:apolipoprotein N-acyltransferase